MGKPKQVNDVNRMGMMMYNYVLRNYHLVIEVESQDINVDDNIFVINTMTFINTGTSRLFPF